MYAPCNHNNPDTEYPCHPEKDTYTRSQSILTTLKSQETSDLHSVSIDMSFLKVSYKLNIQHISLLCLLLLLSIICVPCINTSFLFITNRYSIRQVYHYLPTIKNISWFFIDELYPI